MGYDLIPINKQMESLSIGAFSWPIMMQDTGMGYVLGYGAGRSPAEYVYQQGNNGSPHSNDGYKVSASEAKMMAKIARGYVSVKRLINKEWDELSPEIRKQQEEFKSLFDGRPIYQTYTAEDFLLKLEKFAAFAENSKGLRIY
jgi:hypothetical protein